MRASKMSPRMERVVAAVIVGLILFWFTYFLDQFLDRIGVRAVDTILNNLAIGILGAAVAYLWARFEAERQARAREKLILVLELNHHIRNALQLISTSASLEDAQTKYRLIDSAVERIDRVLTELVPTAGETPAPRFFLDREDVSLQQPARGLGRPKEF